MGLWQWLFGDGTPAPKNNYKIIKYDHEEYMATVWCDGMAEWAAIDKLGDDGVAAPSAYTRFADSYVCKTEEEAGDRINLHAKSEGGMTVWSN